MEITCRDFLDRPYLRGFEYCKEAFKASSLQERVTKIAWAILLFIPVVNIVVHLISKRSVCRSPLLKLNPHLSPMSIQEKSQYADHSSDLPRRIGTWDISTREARLGTNYERMALIKVSNRKGSSQVFDLRKVYTDPTLGITLYCPFEIHLFPDHRTYIQDRNAGWLLLGYGKDVIHINRIDNFRGQDFRLGSALVQFAIEMSLKAGYGGKVALHTTNSSAGFYYRLGFVCKNAECQKRLVKEYQNNKITIDDVDMYLPPEAIAIWEQKIAKTPILSS